MYKHTDLKMVANLLKRANYLKKGGKIMAENILNVKDLSDDLVKRKKDVLSYLKDLDSNLEIKETPTKQDIKLNLTKLDLDDTTNDQIKSKAEDSLSYYKASNQTKINNDFDVKQSKLNKELKDNKETLQNKVDNINDEYEQNGKSLTDKFIKQGTARSSILNNYLDDVEKQALRDMEEVKSNYAQKIKTLEDDKQTLEEQREKALSDFDIAYAVTLQEKIDDITKDIQSYNQKAIKYNNEVNEKEQNFLLKYQNEYEKDVKENEENNRKILEFLTKYGYGTLSVRLREQKADYVRNYLNGLDKISAMKVLTEDDEFKNSLGEVKYNQLLNEVKERKD